jgi:electron transport complex protein RnfC
MNSITQSKYVSLARFTLPGGIHPPEFKSISNAQTISSLSEPNQVTLLIEESMAPRLLVKEGDEVVEGQPLFETNSEYSAVMIHSPLTGIIVDIGAYYFGHPSGQSQDAITIRVTEKNNNPKKFRFDRIENWQQSSIDELIERIRLAGIVGLGGAAFPTQVKLDSSVQKTETLIINAMECEPYITCDDRLLREQSEKILTGAKITAHIVGAKKITFGIEDNKPEAVKALTAAIESSSNDPFDVTIVVAKTSYPSGGEKQIIQLLTGKEVPAGKYPASLGILVQNVATVYAINEAVVDGSPLFQRVVTLTGDLVQQPGNYWLPIGTPVTHIAAMLKIDMSRLDRIIFGGPLMGQTIFDLNVVTRKSTNCIIFNPSKNNIDSNERSNPTKQFNSSHKECIRCADCEQACPVSLLPQQLYWHAKNQQWDKIQEQNLFDCIECGACSYVCPSEIPLVDYFRFAKSEVKFNQQKQKQSELAKRRFDNRELRLARIKTERELKRQKTAEARRKAAENQTSDPEGKKSAIADALARVKKKKDKLS